MASKPPPNPYIAGPPISNEIGFFGREEIIEDVERALRQTNYNSVILHGQRRIGKTSLLLQLERRLPSPPFFTVYFDLAGKGLLPVGQILHQLAAAAADIANIPAPALSDFENNPAAFDQGFLPALRRALGNQRQPVFLLDEFGALDTPEEELEPTAAIRGLDDYLYDLLKKQNYANFIFAAGRRMTELSAVVESSFKADLTRFISVLDPEQARTLILQPHVAGIPSYDEAAVERILALTRGHPYLTQRICHMLYERAYSRSQQKPTVTIKDVDAVIPEFLEANDESLTLIWNSLPPAEHITLAAMAGHGTEEDGLFGDQDITDTLSEAGISSDVSGLSQAPENLTRWQMFERLDGGYRFFIPLMQRWVARKHPLEQITDTELTHLDPAADALYQAAQQSYEEGNNKEAIDQLYRALSINPNHLPARMLLGKILSEEEQLTEAVAQYEEAYKLDRTTALAPLIAALLSLGAALEEARNYPDALAAYDRVLALEPDNKTAKAHRTAVLKKLGQPSKTKVVSVTKTEEEERKKRRIVWGTAFILATILIPLLCLLLFLSGNNPFGTNQRATAIAQANTATAAAAAQIAATDTAATVSAIAAARTATSEASQPTPTPAGDTSSTPTLDAQAATAAAAATATAATEATALAAPVSDLSGQIRVVGSNAMQPVIKALADAFTRQHPNVEVSIRADGSKAGLAALQQGNADIGMVSRELDEAEAVAFSESQRHTLAEDEVIAIITHALVSVDNLSTEQVRAIFAGEITNWSQVGGPDTPIIVVTGDENSDTRTVFEQTLLGGTGINVTETTIEVSSDTAMRNIVSGQPYAIGYTPLRLTGVDPEIPPDSENWAVLDTAWLEVNVIALDGVQPSPENVANGSYPLTRPMNILTQEQPDEPVKTWLEFISSPEGQQIIEGMGHTPTP